MNNSEESNNYFHETSCVGASIARTCDRTKGAAFTASRNPRRSGRQKRRQHGGANARQLTLNGEDQSPLSLPVSIWQKSLCLHVGSIKARRAVVSRQGGAHQAGRDGRALPSGGIGRNRVLGRALSGASSPGIWRRLALAVAPAGQDLPHDRQARSGRHGRR